MAALEQTIKDLTSRVYAQEVRISGLVATIGTMDQRMSHLEAALQQQRAAAAGHGSSVR